MTLEGRPFEPFPWRINGLRAFSGQANRLLTLHNRYLKPGSYNRVSKKAANRPKVPRRMTGRRRGVPPLLDPTRPLKRPPIPPGATPLGRLAASPHVQAPGGGETGPRPQLGRLRHIERRNDPNRRKENGNPPDRRLVKGAV